MLLQSLLTRLAAAGLATKAAAGGTAVVVAASAAGAADALPAPAQETFDGLVAAETVDVEEEPGSEVERDERNGDATFGERVSQDATGESDGEPGVDGAEIACEASEGRSGNCEDAGTQDGGVEGAQDDEHDFGARVSADATGESDGEPGVDGEQISSEARARNADRRGERAGQAQGDARRGGPDDAADADDDEGDDGPGVEGGPRGTGGAAASANRPGDDG